MGFLLTRSQSEICIQRTLYFKLGFVKKDNFLVPGHLQKNNLTCTKLENFAKA